MKKIKRFLTIGLAIMLTFCISVSFVACKEEEYVAGPIPDGRYARDSNEENGKSTCYYNESVVEFYWEIVGDNATFTGSGLTSLKAKVVEKDGKIYFECYRWTTIIDIIIDLLFLQKPIMQGSEDVYLLEYNAEEKTITVELYKEGG